VFPPSAEEIVRSAFSAGTPRQPPAVPFPAMKLLISNCSVMRVKLNPDQRPSRRLSGFTIVEAVVAMGIIGVLVVALYAGMTSATFSIRLARENLRATEVMVEKMECLRLYTWDQLTNTAYLPTSFTAYYYDTGATNGVGQGITYTGTVALTKLTTADRNYSNDMRMVTITLNWSSANLARTRTLSTYCGRYGIQNYVIQ
jgi:type II secretory pathway pseudopilin PulG